MKMTEWFPYYMRPIRDGLYETRVDPFDSSYWTWSVFKNGMWHYASASVEVSIERAALGAVSAWQSREWRGLAEQPK